MKLVSPIEISTQMTRNPALIDLNLFMSNSHVAKKILDDEKLNKIKMNINGEQSTVHISNTITK